MKKFSLLILLISLFCTRETRASSAAVNSYTITFSNGNLTYFPNNLVVQSGDIVTIIGNFGSHPLTEVSHETWCAGVAVTPLPGGIFKTSGTSFDYPTTTPGTKYFMCAAHGVADGEKMAITVQCSQAAPTGNTTPAFVTGSTLASLTLTGSNIRWYSSATWSALNCPLATTTPLVSGTTYYATQTVGACESSALLAVTPTIANPCTTTTSFVNESICQGSSFTFNGIAQTTAGSYLDTLVNGGGCDSIVTLNLSIKATSTSTTNLSICPSELPYSWNGLSYTGAGTQTAHLTNSVGCDSAATLNLTLKTTSTSITNLAICPSELPYSWNGLTFITAGSQTAHLTNSVGCDSAATLNLALKATSTSTTNLSICPNELPYSSNGLTFTAAGSQTYHILNSVGCDSAVTLNLTIKATSTSTTNLSICPNELPYSWNGLTFTSGGSQIAHLTNSAGCDSTATLNLSVLPSMELKGNGNAIVNGATTTSTSNKTDFGSMMISGSVSISTTFTIYNNGSTALSLGNIVKSGTAPGDFTITSSPSSTLGAMSSTTFTVKFKPTSTSLRSAILTINNNSCLSNPFIFAVSGFGVNRPPVTPSN